jgi:transposase
VTAITEHKATPFIAFESNATGKASPLWEKMFHYFSFKREEYLEHYHKRSNIESTFSMVNANSGIPCAAKPI